MQLICDGHTQICAHREAQLILSKPTMLDQPLLEGASAADGGGCSIYGTVIRDGGVYRMWYNAYPRLTNALSGSLVGCVESDDGLNWRRPSYGIFECEGTKANHLTDLLFHCPSIFIDPHAGPGQRYRAVGMYDPGSLRAQGLPARGPCFGYYMAHSADGLHWVLDGDEPLWPNGDVVISTWDPAHNCALIAMKKMVTRGGLYRRSFYASEWADGNLTRPVLTWCADEYDDLHAHMRGFMAADYYGLGLMPTETGTALGFLWNFRHMPPHVDIVGHYGRTDLSIVYRTERGSRWQHVPGRPDWFCAEDAPEWARGGLYTASTPIHVADETYLYVTGTRDRHGACGLQPYDLTVKESAKTGGLSRIGLLKWRRDRIMGLRTLWDGIVELETPVPAPSPSRLQLNVETRSGGHVRVQLLSLQDASFTPIDGYAFDECEPIAGNHQCVTVRWGDRDLLPMVKPGAKLVARVMLDRATLWAFDFAV